MVKVTYIAPDGIAHSVDGVEGASLMETAKQNGVAGIDADCGGACACATCHVHVDPLWIAVVGPAEGDEADLLQFANDPDDTSRLSCQVRLTLAMDGLVVHTPVSQR